MKTFIYTFIALFISLSVKAKTSCSLAVGQSVLPSNLSTGGQNNFKLGRQASKEEVLEHYVSFESSDEFKKGRIAHGVLAQTSWLTGQSFSELNDLLAEIPDLSVISNDPAARVLVLQTLQLSSKSFEEFLDYFQSFPDISGVSRSNLSFLVLVQTALLTSTDPLDFVSFVESFPRTSYTKKEIGFGIIVQSTFLTEHKNANSVYATFRFLVPYLFATANKGVVALAKQTEFFARGLHLEE